MKGCTKRPLTNIKRGYDFKKKNGIWMVSNKTNFKLFYSQSIWMDQSVKYR
jgi:hypothetical protein